MILDLLVSVGFMTGCVPQHPPKPTPANVDDAHDYAGQCRVTWTSTAGVAGVSLVPTLLGYLRTHADLQKHFIEQGGTLSAQGRSGTFRVQGADDETTCDRCRTYGGDCGWHCTGHFISSPFIAYVTRSGKSVWKRSLDSLSVSSRVALLTDGRDAYVVSFGFAENGATILAFDASGRSRYVTRVGRTYCPSDPDMYYVNEGRAALRGSRLVVWGLEGNERYIASVDVRTGTQYCERRLDRCEQAAYQ